MCMSAKLKTDQRILFFADHELPNGADVPFGRKHLIEQAYILDLVLTAEGNIGTVRQLMVREEKDSLICLQLCGHAHLRMTAEHPVLTRRGYIRADKIRLDDWVAMPRYLPESKKLVQTADHVVTKRWTVRTNVHCRYAGVAGRAAALTVRVPLPDIIHLTPGAGRIFGLFFAEGNTEGAKVVWSFHIK